VRRGLVLAALLLGARALAAEPTLVALNEAGTLLVFPADRPGTARAVAPSGVADRLVGVDVRPADGRLYGLTAASELYRLDPRTGVAESVAMLTVPFDGEDRSGVDFNPQADRLRLLSAEGQNLRVHPTLGAAAVDRPLTWKPGDPNAGRRPRVTAAAYSQNVAGTAETKLFVIDAERDVLALQDPPNDGVLATVGPLGVDFGPRGGFDIRTGANGVDRAWAASGNVLYAVDLTSGAAERLGEIGGGEKVSVVGLAVLPDAAP
jgi:Domain of unknown function (DUF4394)